MSDQPEKTPEARLDGFNLRKSLSRAETSPGQWYLPAWVAPNDDRTVLIRRPGELGPEYFIVPLDVFLRFNSQEDPNVVWTEIPP